MSMLQDIRQGRPFEVEAILGNVMRVAEKEGVAVPRLQTMYALPCSSKTQVRFQIQC